MRIAFFSNAYQPTISGVVTSIRLFRQGLVEKGHEISIIAPEHTHFIDSEPYIFRAPAIDFSKQVDMNLAIPLRGPLERTISGLKPQVIHSHHPTIMGDVAASFSRHKKIPLVFTYHTLYKEYAQKYVPFMPKLAGIIMDGIVDRYLDQCTHIIAPTVSIRDLIYRKYAVKSPVTIVHTPVDLSRYQKLDPQKMRDRFALNDCKVLLYAGRLSEEKNLTFLIQSFARLVHSFAKARLMLVGRGVDEALLRKLVKNLQLDEQVVFTGPVSFEDIPHYAAAADLFVFPSQTDTQGLVLIEAMAAGTPVVAVDAPSSRDVLQHGGGILAPAQLDQFADILLHLLTDPARLQALSTRARQVVQQYDIPTAVDRLVAVYQDAIASYSSSPERKQG